MQTVRGRLVSLPPVAVLLSSSWLAACGGDDPAVVDGGVILDAGPGRVEVPLGQSLPPLAYVLAVDHDVALNFSPETISGHLFLDVGDDGSIEGVASARVDGRVGLQTITGEVRGAHVVLQLTDLVVPEGGLLGFDELRLWLLDDDGDGAIDGARGEGTGEWGASAGIDYSFTRQESVLISTLDQERTQATLTRPFRDSVVPQDELRIQFGEALREADVLEHLRVSTGDDDVPGQLLLEPLNGFVVSATFQPDEFLPLGAQLRLDLGELTDVAGNRLSDRSNHLDVVGDPGPIAGNLGFESGLTGWIALGNASTQGAVDGFAPAEGAAQAVLGVAGSLGAVLELPTGATELELSITTLTRGDGAVPPPVGILLHRPGGGVVDVDVTPLDDAVADCETCSLYEWQNGPVRLTLSLEGIESGPVALEMYSFASAAVEDDQVVLIDDIQVR